MTYVSGDTNGDQKPDTTEMWLYVCSSPLAQTTTNTAIATGNANGFTARDFAVATVVVAVAAPSLPNTGFDPEESGTPWSATWLAVMVSIVTLSLVLVLRKRTV